MKAKVAADRWESAVQCSDGTVAGYAITMMMTMISNSSNSSSIIHCFSVMWLFPRATAMMTEWFSIHQCAEAEWHNVSVSSSHSQPCLSWTTRFPSSSLADHLYWLIMHDNVKAEKYSRKKHEEAVEVSCLWRGAATAVHFPSRDKCTTWTRQSSPAHHDKCRINSLPV